MTDQLQAQPELIPKTQNPTQTLIQIQVLWQVPAQPHLPVELSAIHMHSFSSAIK